MLTVQIDGKEYVPADQATGSFGVAITTFSRPRELRQTVDSVLATVPAGTPIVVVDDHGSPAVSDIPGVTVVRNDKNLGIAGAKNRCLDELSKTDAEHYFLLDDDVVVTDPLIWSSFIDSREPHLMATYDIPKGETGKQLTELYRDDTTVHFHATRGFFLYVERRVVDAVGGMDPDFGKWGWEHMSWSDRIHSAGFTTSRYMDIIGSSEMVRSLDQEGAVKSSATKSAMDYAEGPGWDLRWESRNSDRYIEYRDLDNVVLTSMLCDQPDPQRGTLLPADATQVKALHNSVKGRRLIVLTTGLKNEARIPSAEIVEIEQDLNPYFQRWLNYYQWLRDNPRVGYVWCVDATDVEMTRDPFPEMEPGTLYFGYEPKTLRDKWMLDNHPDKTVHSFMGDNPNHTLLNMGVVGGDRETVMSFAHHMVKLYFDDHTDFINGWETKRLGVGDMGAGQYVAHTFFTDQVSSGPHVTNVFKSNVPSPTAWFKHK